MNKKYADENLQEIIDKYIKKTINTKMSIFRNVYDDINVQYKRMFVDKSKEEKFEFVKFERYRLENIKVEINSNPTAINASLFVLIVVIGITILPMQIEALKTEYKLIILSASVIAYISSITYLFRKMLYHARREKIIDVAIKVLDDIEKEIVEEQVKLKEETKKLEKRKWIEQNINKGRLFKRKLINLETITQDEIAATANDGSDEKFYTNLKGIGAVNSFINIVFYKKLNNKK